MLPFFMICLIHTNMHTCMEKNSSFSLLLLAFVQFLAGEQTGCGFSALSLSAELETPASLSQAKLFLLVRN